VAAIEYPLVRAVGERVREASKGEVIAKDPSV
jgi:hypothetical protein